MSTTTNSPEIGTRNKHFTWICACSYQGRTTLCQRMACAMAEADLRKLITQIQLDQTLTDAEKAKKRQELLSGQWKQAPPEADAARGSTGMHCDSLLCILMAGSPHSRVVCSSHKLPYERMGVQARPAAAGNCLEACCILQMTPGQTQARGMAPLSSMRRSSVPSAWTSAPGPSRWAPLPARHCGT